MSDGPHRTLKLRPHWKRVAKRAYEQAFDSKDVIDATCPALERDWWWEIPSDFMKELRAFCAGEEPSLFQKKDLDADQLKHLTAGRGTLGGIVAQCAADALAEGKSGDEAVRQAVLQALLDRLVRNGRSMEEHFLREAGTRRAEDVRSRIANAITQAPIEALADKLTSKPASATAAPPKHQGLDDGVGL